jgi:hypothetical protein
MLPEAPPPYPCTGAEPVIDIVELIDGDGQLVNRITGSACFADWYAPQIACTWRVYEPPDLDPDPAPDPAPPAPKK